MSFLAVPLLVLVFVGCAGVIWVADIQLSKTTDVLDDRLHLGSALGGVVLLAIATDLPEIAITVTAAASDDIGVAIGNILGGIALQTVVLVALDAFGGNTRRPLSCQAASWLAGIALLSKARGQLPWHDSGEAPDNQAAPQGHAKTQKNHQATAKKISTARAATVFSVAALATLAAGFFLEQSGDALAHHIGLTGVLFGATVLAAAASLPELSTGITSVRLGDTKSAVSDIFGGNAFLPVLFLVATLISGQPALPQAQDTDIHLTGLGILLTVVDVFGLLFRPHRTIARMGPDSVVVLLLYVVGIGGLVAIAGRPVTW